MSLTDNLLPPPGAVILFNGQDLSNWKTRQGEAAGWRVEDGITTVVSRTGDIVSNQQFGDCYLHLEFRCPNMPEATGQAKGNSGVFMQGRYEIQVLDSYNLGRPGKGDCGAIYNQHAPLQNACRPPLEWQTYDIVFRAARVDEAGNVTENARITLLHNGLTVHNNVEMQGVTGGTIDQNVGEPGPLLLQDHRDEVSYRNIWYVPLPTKGSDNYGPGD
jgi:hypothetical protein